MNWLTNITGIKELMWGRPAPLGLVLAALAAVIILTLFLTMQGDNAKPTDLE